MAWGVLFFMPVPRLIEVALPIREISAESVRDKSLRHGHISTLHLWWARRPLAASRAVVFASLLPDPDHPDCPPEFVAATLRLLRDAVPSTLRSYSRGRFTIHDSDPYKPYEGVEDTARNRLLCFLAKWSRESLDYERGKGTSPTPAHLLDPRCLVRWETGDPNNAQGRAVLEIARELVKVAAGGKAPRVLDPFAGGGAIPLEATRLGAQAIANDLNPVAHLIQRATCEWPQKFGPASGHDLAGDLETRAGAILARAREQLGGLYPAGRDGVPVVGYLWARTAPCANPSCRATIPLLRSLLVCNKDRKKVALTLHLDGAAKVAHFGIARDGDIKESAGTMVEKGRGAVKCPFCGQTTPVTRLREAGLNGTLGEQMVAVITDTRGGKSYRAVEPTDLQAWQRAVELAQNVEAPNEAIIPEVNGPDAPSDVSHFRSINVDGYGMKTWGSLFNPRQLLAMQTLVSELRGELKSLENEENDAEYRTVLAGYLGLWIGRLASFQNRVSRWRLGVEAIASPFAMQAIPMMWD